MPSTIASGARIANAGAWSARAGFATASALYALTQNTTTGKLSVWTSTDGTTWTEKDAANAPTNFSATTTFTGWLHTNGFLYVVYFTLTDTMRVKRFDTATDTWEAGNIGGTLGTSHNNLNVRAVVRSDGDVLVVRTFATGTNCGILAYEGVTWTSTSLSFGAWVQDAVINDDDRAWFSIADNTANDNSYRSFSATNVLGLQSDFDATANTTEKMRGLGARIFNDGTNNRYATLGRDTGGELDLYTGTVGAAELGSPLTTNAVTTTTAPQPTSADVAYADTGAGNRVHVVWATANAILRDVSTTAAPAYTFGVDTTVLSGLTDTDPCPQWITGGGGLGVLYQDNGDVKVEWVTSPNFGVDATGTTTVGTATSGGGAQTASAGATATVTTGTATAVGSAQTGTVGGGDATGTTTVGTATATGGAITASAGATATTTAGGSTATGGAEIGSAGGTGTTTASNAAATGGAQGGTVSYAGTVTVGVATATGGSQAATAGATGALVIGTATVVGGTQTGTDGTGGGATGTVTAGSATGAGGTQTASAGSTGTTAVGSATADGGVQTGGIGDAGTIITGTAIASGGDHTATSGATGVVVTGTAVAAGGIHTGGGVTPGDLNADLTLAYALTADLVVSRTLDADVIVARVLTADLTFA